MRVKLFSVAISCLLFLLASPSGQAAKPANMTVKDISDCMRVNVFDRGAVRDFQIKAIDREGKSNKLKFKAFWKPSKTSDDIRITLQVIEPKALKGTAYLVEKYAHSEKLYLYLPAIRRVRTIVGGEANQKLWGSDFSIADIKQIQGLLLDGDAKRLPDASIDGRPVYLIETLGSAPSPYRKVRSFIDQQSCLLLKAELFSDDGQPHKILTADVSTLLDIDPWWLIQSYRMSDQRAGTRTDLWLSDIFIKERLPEALFTPQGFYIEQE
jgi:hypothetical protein